LKKSEALETGIAISNLVVVKASARVLTL